jgi:hypothetical protein
MDLMHISIIILLFVDAQNTSFALNIKRAHINHYEHRENGRYLEIYKKKPHTNNI